MESSSVSTQVKSKMATLLKCDCEDMNVSEMSVCSTAMEYSFIGEVSPVKCGRTNPCVKYFLDQSPLTVRKLCACVLGA